MGRGKKPRVRPIDRLTDYNLYAPQAVYYSSMLLLQRACFHTDDDAMKRFISFFSSLLTTSMKKDPRRLKQKLFIDELNRYMYDSKNGFVIQSQQNAEFLEFYIVWEHLVHSTMAHLIKLTLKINPDEDFEEELEDILKDWYDFLEKELKCDKWREYLISAMGGLNKNEIGNGGELGEKRREQLEIMNRRKQGRKQLEFKLNLSTSPSETV